jgi:hypothetical protein
MFAITGGAAERFHLKIGSSARIHHTQNKARDFPRLSLHKHFASDMRLCVLSHTRCRSRSLNDRCAFSPSAS